MMKFLVHVRGRLFLRRSSSIFFVDVNSTSYAPGQKLLSFWVCVLRSRKIALLPTCEDSRETVETYANNK